MELLPVIECCSPLRREPLSQSQAVDVARMFKALGDPVRLRLFLIAKLQGGASGYDIAAPATCC